MGSQGRSSGSWIKSGVKDKEKHKELTRRQWIQKEMRKLRKEKGGRVVEHSERTY
jgi:hypothetical protein